MAFARGKMEFRIDRVPNPNVQHYADKELDHAYDFAKKAYKEFGNFVKAIVLFGGAAKRKTKVNDIDILIIVDDISAVISPEMVDAYRVIVEKIVNDVSPKLHITTLKFTNFWEFARAGDPIVINILRDGIALLDNNFFEPLQALLMRGRIRPTPESIQVYYQKAPMTLQNAKWHVLQATLDLYWAVIDSAHAALMSIGEVPPSPEHVSDLMVEKMLKKRLVEKKHVLTMNKFYTLSKKIVTRDVGSISGKEFDLLYKEADEFIKKMNKIIEKR